MLMTILGMVALACIVGGDATALEDVQPDIEVFIHTGCPHCEAAQVFLNELRREQLTLRILIHDLHGEPEAMVRFKKLADTLKVRHLGVPAFYLRGELLTGYDRSGQTDARIRSLLESLSPQTTRQVPADTSPSTAVTSSPQKATPSNLGSRGRGCALLWSCDGAGGRASALHLCHWSARWLQPLLDVGARVHVGVVASLQDRLKMVLIAGTFVAVEGLAYFAFMAVWLNVFLLSASPVFRR